MSPQKSLISLTWFWEIFLKVTKWSSLVAQQVKDPALSLQQLRTLLWCKLDSWPGNFCIVWVWQEKKKVTTLHVLWCVSVFIMRMISATLIESLLCWMAKLFVQDWGSSLVAGLAVLKHRKSQETGTTGHPSTVCKLLYRLHLMNPSYPPLGRFSPVGILHYKGPLERLSNLL